MADEPATTSPAESEVDVPDQLQALVLSVRHIALEAEMLAQLPLDSRRIDGLASEGAPDAHKRGTAA